MEMKHVMELISQVADVDSINLEEDVEIDGNFIKIAGVGSGEYIVLDEEEIRDRMVDRIKETASYFYASFLARMTDLPEEVFEALVDKNTAVCKLIEKTCGMDAFIDECLSTDGAGHFLNSYNGEEYELGDGLSAFDY